MNSVDRFIASCSSWEDFWKRTRQLSDAEKGRAEETIVEAGKRLAPALALCCGGGSEDSRPDDGLSETEAARHTAGRPLLLSRRRGCGGRYDSIRLEGRRETSLPS
jgi:hypothetical protein